MIYSLLAGLAAYLLAKSTRSWGAYVLTPVAAIFVAAGSVVLVSSTLSEPHRSPKALIEMGLAGLCFSPFVLSVLIWLIRRWSTPAATEEAQHDSLQTHRRASYWAMGLIGITFLIFLNAVFPNESHELGSAQGLIDKANSGDVEAQIALADSYSGREKYGLKKDLSAAASWYLKAAEKGDAEAQHKLGNCYLHGLGVTENPAEAAKWFRKAAETGYAEAQASLGFCYERGLGVPTDLAEAQRWYVRGASQGDADAQALLKELQIKKGVK